MFRVESAGRIHDLPESFRVFHMQDSACRLLKRAKLIECCGIRFKCEVGVPVTDADLILPVEETQKSSSPSLLLSSAAFVGSLVEGACAILVASASAKLFVGLGAVAGAVKASRLHSDIVRIPVLLVSATAALITLLVLWNAWRARNRSAARWRKKPMTLREKFSFAIALLASVLTLALAFGEAIEHPIFHVH